MASRQLDNNADCCPNCGGRLVQIGERVWCMTPYDEGGCGGFWASDKSEVSE